MNELHPDNLLAASLDRSDPLASFRGEFHLPAGTIYLDGNSLGPLSRDAESAVRSVMDAWSSQAIGGWLSANPPWFDMTARLSDVLAPLVGADSSELVIANSTTVNLHQLLATFYEPESGRDRIVIDELAFPTDRYAVDSHLRRRCQDVVRCRRLIPSRDGRTLDERDIVEALDESVQLAILPSVVFTSGQLLDIPTLVESAHRRGVLIGFDCSHSVGVVEHRLSDWGVDFAFFCTYKYLNGGPGAPAAIFVHRRHHGRVPGMAGWFGSRKETQFKMPADFDPGPGAHAYQLGTPHILSLAPLMGSLRLVAAAGIPALRTKSQQLTTHLRQWIRELCGDESPAFADPHDPCRRGGHIALVHSEAGAIARALRDQGVIVDYRPPDIVRLAPAPLYTTFTDCWNAATKLSHILKSNSYRAFASIQDRIP